MRYSRSKFPFAGHRMTKPIVLESRGDDQFIAAALGRTHATLSSFASGLFAFTVFIARFG